MAVGFALLMGCAGRPVELAQMTPPVAALELEDTVFFPQAEYQCGPAALATVLHSAGREIHPDALAPQVYLPQREGSLQVELLAATRRAGLIPYVIDPSSAALFAELGAGRPVLVLQNLGLRILPVWHYAVVIGADPVSDRIILRSGLERRRLSPTRDFMRSWASAERWAMVVLRPGELPATGERKRYLAAVARAGGYLTPMARVAAYRAAQAHWGDSGAAQFGLAHALYEAGRLGEAGAAYRRLLRRHPRHAAGWNNLAEVLSARGCIREARQSAERALELAHAHYPGLVAAVRATLVAIPASDGAEQCSAADITH